MFRLPSTIPIDEYPPPNAFIEEAERLVSLAQKSGVVLRVMGGMAVYMRCPTHFKEVWKNLKRLGDRVFTDIDFVSYGRFKDQMIDFMKSAGYQTSPELLVQAGKGRQIFFGGKVPMVEVFYDALDMNHLIQYDGRLELDRLTVPLADLMLQKLQIVKINDKDIKDLVVLLATHDVGKEDPEKIDVDFIVSRYMQTDWGFCYTATGNLEKVKNALSSLESLSQEEKDRVSRRASAILDAINQAPKAAKWKLRAKLGPKIKWYSDVDDW
jgi:hypothetical protein